MSKLVSVVVFVYKSVDNILMGFILFNKGVSLMVFDRNNPERAKNKKVWLSGFLEFNKDMPIFVSILVNVLLILEYVGDLKVVTNFENYSSLSNNYRVNSIINKRHYSTSWSNNNTSGSQIKKPLGFLPKWTTNVYFYPHEITEEILLERIGINLKAGITYGFLIKIKVDDYSFRMGDKHFTFTYTSELDFRDRFADLYSHVEGIKERYEELYNETNNGNYTSWIEYIQIMYITLRPFPDLQIKNINKLPLNKGMLNIRETKRNFNNSTLPLSTNIYYYGTKLNKTINNLGIIEAVWVEGSNFIDLVKDKSYLVNKTVNGSTEVDFYLYTNSRGNKRIIVVKIIDEKNQIKEVLSLTGSPLTLAYDEIIIKDIEFKRRIGKTSFYIKAEEVIKYEVEQNLPVIKPPKVGFKSVSNSKIGSFDVETFFHEDKNQSYVYALGFKAYNEIPQLFYLKENETSDHLIITCINKMLKPKYHGYIFYVHYLGGYDAVFLLGSLTNYNEENNNYYTLKPVLRDNRVIKLSISIKTKSGTIKISLVDSFNLLGYSLDSLCKTFDTEVVKGRFPYNFVRSSTLNYIGDTPGKHYYQDITDQEYELINKSDWNLKEETLLYLKKDLISLLEVMVRFNKYIYQKYDQQVTDALTISRLALNIYLTNYLGESKIPLINHPQIFNFIKLGYYGGITEVYRPYCEGGNYYDVNSQYPFVSKNPLPGNKCVYIEDFTGLGLDLNKLFGFFYCKITTNNGYLGLLPLHTKGSLILPNGEFVGVWFSEELKFAAENGYQITVIKGYQFNRIENVFNKYVDELFQNRSKSFGIEKAVTKMLLNAPFGRFGMSILKPISEFVNREKLELTVATHEVKSWVQLNEDYFLITYVPQISKTVCEASGFDYIKVLNSQKKDMEKNRKFQDVSISTAAAITSYARIFMNKVKIWILDNKGLIYYMDTDSIVTNISLPNELVGDRLGQFKKEYQIEKGYFISAKTYYLKTIDGEEIKRAKGVTPNSLSSRDYGDMYWYNKDVLAEKWYADKDYTEGYVNIIRKNAILNHDAYKKRKKSYDSKGYWIDTKPLVFRVENNKNLQKE